MIFSRANFITQEDLQGIALLEEDGYLMRTIKEVCASGWTERTLDLKYFIDVENGVLDPSVYGELIVLDAFYSFNSAVTLFIIRDLMQKRPEYSDFMEEMNIICDRILSFTNSFVKYWHLSDGRKKIDFAKHGGIADFIVPFVVPTNTIKDYLSFEEQVLEGYKDTPIVALIALFPCYAFWPILFRKVDPDKVPNNVYKEWIIGNRGGKTAILVDTMLDEYWKELPTGAYAEKIRSVMNNCIEYEYKIFKESTMTPAENTGI